MRARYACDSEADNNEWRSIIRSIARL